RAGSLCLAEMRFDRGEQLRRRRVRLRLRPADDRLARVRGQPRLDLASELLRRDDHELRSAQPPHALVDLAADGLEVVGDELLDVALEARLRPAALIVPARLLLALVDDLVELAAAQPEDLTALTVDERDQGPVVAAGEPDERRQPQLLAEMHG